MPSGVQVYLVESHSITMVDMQIDFDAGSRRDPADKAGLAGVTASMVSKGVAAAACRPALDENALSEAWADLEASFRAGASADRMSFSLRSLTFLPTCWARQWHWRRASWASRPFHRISGCASASG